MNPNLYNVRYRYLGANISCTAQIAPVQQEEIFCKEEPQEVADDLEVSVCGRPHFKAACEALLAAF